MVNILKLLIYTYRMLTPSGLGTCRFQPTCSQYFIECLEKYGAVKGSVAGVKRIFSCHPFSRRNLYDPA